MKYILSLSALLLGGQSGVEAHTYYSYPTYQTYEYVETCEEYVPAYPVQFVRRVVEPVCYYYPTYRPRYRTYRKSCHRHNPLRGGFSFTFGY